MESHHVQWKSPLCLAIFHSYVNLPEGAETKSETCPELFQPIFVLSYRLCQQFVIAFSMAIEIVSCPSENLVDLSIAMLNYQKVNHSDFLMNINEDIYIYIYISYIT